MKPSKTTIYGTTAACSYAAAQLPSLPPWMRTAFEIGAAVSMAQLGRHASDCPPNCPGTDTSGRPLRGRPLVGLPVLVLGAILAALLLLSACVAPNPNANSGRPDEPAYVVSPGLPVVSNTAVQIAREVGNLTTTGPLLVPTVVGIFAAIGGISGLIAQHRSHKNTIAALKDQATRPAKSPIDAPGTSG